MISSRAAVRHIAARRVTAVPAVRAASAWSKVPQGPPDAILGITEAYKADSHPEKINLGVYSPLESLLSQLELHLDCFFL